MTFFTVLGVLWYVLICFELGVMLGALIDVGWLMFMVGRSNAKLIANVEAVIVDLRTKRSA